MDGWWPGVVCLDSANCSWCEHLYVVDRVLLATLDFFLSWFLPNVTFQTVLPIALPTTTKKAFVDSK